MYDVRVLRGPFEDTGTGGSNSSFGKLNESNKNLMQLGDIVQKLKSNSVKPTDISDAIRLVKENPSSKESFSALGAIKNNWSALSHIKHSLYFDRIQLGKISKDMKTLLDNVILSSEQMKIVKQNIWLIGEILDRTQIHGHC